MVPMELFLTNDRFVHMWPYTSVVSQPMADIFTASWISRPGDHDSPLAGGCFIGPVGQKLYLLKVYGSSFVFERVPSLRTSAFESIFKLNLCTTKLNSLKRIYVKGSSLLKIRGFYLSNLIHTIRFRSHVISFYQLVRSVILFH